VSTLEDARIGGVVREHLAQQQTWWPSSLSK
jgi:hypothetical protein